MVEGAGAGGSLHLGELIDKYGEGLYPDLLYYYGIDLVEVVEGRGPAPLFVLSLVWRLPEDSLTSALMRGGREHFGWSTDRHIAANIYDALNVNTQASGNWSKKPPKFDPMPRPKAGKAKKKPRTLRELYAVVNKGR